MADTLVFTLPAVPDRDRPDTHWWLVVDGAVADSGAGPEWPALTFGADGLPRRTVALAPAASARLLFADRAPDGATPRQAEAIARVAAIESSLGDDETLHAVSATGSESRVVTAVVDNGVMLAWLDWSAAFGVDPQHIIPVASLLPLAERWTQAQFGSEHIVGRDGLVMPYEPELTAAIIGDAEVASLGPEEAATAIAAAAEEPPIDLRSGRFARRRRFQVDRDRIRELLLLAALVAFLALATVILSLVRLDRSTDRLNDETLALAETALGKPVTLESAEAELRARAGSRGHGGFLPPLTALYQRLQAEAGVSSTDIGFRPDGTLTATLASPTVDAINRLLIVLQRDGYRVTAVPRQSPDGRSMVEITIRSGP